MSSKEPFFLIANPRSGSTLLRLMLTSHPNICVPPECGWAVCKSEKYSDCGDGICYEDFVEDFFDASTKKVETWNLSGEELLLRLQEKQPQTYAELVDAVYRLYIDVHQPGKMLWGDKNNFYIHHIDELKRIFPRAKYVFLFRDGRDVAVSYMDMKQYKQKYAPDVTTDPVQAFQEWADVQTELESVLPKDQCISVQYEALVHNPSAELERICSFLEQRYSPEMLLYHRMDYEPKETMPWKQQTKTPPVTTRIHRWKNRFTEEQIADIDRIICSRPNLNSFLCGGSPQ